MTHTEALRACVEALEDALEWLQSELKAGNLCGQLDAAIADARKALEAQAEPVAWLCELAEEDGTVRTQIVTENPEGLRWNDAGDPSPFRVTPLYAAPQPATVPVLTAFSGEQARRLWINSPEIQPDAPSFAAFKRVVRLVELAHGISVKPAEGGSDE